MLETLRFTLPEILSLIGLTQCVYILVYMGFRAGNFKRTIIPALYFLCLGGAFFADFGHRFIAESFSSYFLLQWALWFFGPPLSVLLIVQIAQIDKTPRLRYFSVLLLVPLAYIFSFYMARDMTAEGANCAASEQCGVLTDWLLIGGLGAGALSMMTIWSLRPLLVNLYTEKKGQERYWLILTLVFANLLFLGLVVFGAGSGFSDDAMMMARSFSGLALVYLAGTSLFRIYPQALDLSARNHQDNRTLSAEDIEIAEKIQNLLDLEKIYHEPSYGRVDLAKELGLPETTISKVINLFFNKSLPQLLNERRVSDAQRLLSETDAPVKTIAEEVGFNSLATFNRVFKEITGTPPSSFRKKTE